jgi:hypothetical protein
MTRHLDRLKELLGSVRLTLSDADGAFSVTWEKRVYPLSSLPLGDIDAAAEAAELLAVAAGIEAAVKAPGRLVPGEPLREGAKALLPRIERARFADAYDAVVLGSGKGEAMRLLYQPMGAGLITTYVEDEGWKFVHLVRGRFDGWQTTPGTVHSVARSNLYHREPVDWQAAEVAIGDGYDASRAVLIDDVFYDRIGDLGAEIAVPGRDLLMVAPAGRRLLPEAVAAAYANAKYPISPQVFRFKGDVLRDASVELEA